MRISTEIVSRSDADVFSLAEGNIWQRLLLRGRAGIGGVPSPGHVPERLAGNSRELPISSHTKSKVVVSGGTRTRGSTGGGAERWWSSLTTP